MRFLSIYKTRERSAPPSQEEICEMGSLVEEGMKAGWLLATEGCLPTALGARVRRCISSNRRTPLNASRSTRKVHFSPIRPTAAPIVQLVVSYSRIQGRAMTAC